VASLIERELTADLVAIGGALEDSWALPLREVFELLAHAIVKRCKEPSRQQLHQIILPLVPVLERFGLVRAQVHPFFDQMLEHLHAQQHQLAPRLRGDDDPARRRREVAAFVAFESVEATVNAAKTRRPDMFSHPSFASELSGLFSKILLE